MIQLLHEVVEWEEEQREVGEVLQGNGVEVREWVREWEQQEEENQRQQEEQEQRVNVWGQEQQQQEEKQQQLGLEQQQQQDEEQGQGQQEQEETQQQQQQGLEQQQQDEEQQEQEQKDQQQWQGEQEQGEGQQQQQQEQQEAPMSTAATAAVNEALQAVACWLPGWYESSLQLLPSLEPLDLMKVMNCIQVSADLGRWEEVEGGEGRTVAVNSTCSSTDKARGSGSVSDSSSISSSGVASRYVPSIVPLLPLPPLGWVVAAVARLHTSRTVLSAEAWLDALQALAVVTRSHPGYTLLVGGDWVASLLQPDAAGTVVEAAAGGGGSVAVKAAVGDKNGAEVEGVTVGGLAGSSSRKEANEVTGLLTPWLSDIVTCCGSDLSDLAPGDLVTLLVNITQ